MSLADNLNQVLSKPQRPIRYDAQWHLPGLIANLTEKDMLNTTGNSVQRGIVADALQELNRDKEAALLRSKLPVYLSGGEFKPRTVSPKVEDAVHQGLMSAALGTELDSDENPLSLTYKPEHIDEATRQELKNRVVAFLNDNHRRLPNVTQYPVAGELNVHPSDLGFAMHMVANRIGGASLDDEEAAFVGNPHTEHLNEELLRQGPLTLTKSPGRKKQLTANR